MPSAACRLACSEPVEGDRIAWTEAAGRNGEVRTIEAVVATRTETADGHEIALRVIRAFGPGAPGPGGSIRRTAGEVTARGCFRAAWSDEARRVRVLNPPKEVQEQTLTLHRGRSHGQRHQHVKRGGQGWRMPLAVRGRSQRRSTEQRRLALHPLPELPFDDRPVVGAERRDRRIHPVKALWLRYDRTDETLGFGPDRAPDA